MTTNRLLRALALCLCAVCMAGCGDDEALSFPEGTASLRMMNESNGKTIMGNSDLYITDSGNFRSDQFPLFDMGERRGVGDIDLPDFVNMAHEVAVTPGHGYLMCQRSQVTYFGQSQTGVITRNAQVYRFYVDSWIEESGKKVGANVHFLLGGPDKDNVLPAWNSTLATLTYDDNAGGFTGILQLPSAKAGDLEICLPDLSGDLLPLKYEIRDNEVIFRLDQSEWDFLTKTFKVQIRHQHVYTEGQVEVAW